MLKIITDFPPQKIYLALSGHAKTKQPSKEGFYYLAKDNFNGFPYWKQRDSYNAIWFRDSWHRGWTVDGIIGPNDITAWPTQISDGYKYWDGYKWQLAMSTELTVIDCE